MDKLWRGAFLNPIMKHRDYCGDITNHFVVKSITQLDDDEIAEYEEDMETDLLVEELEQVGDGGIPWLVTIGFIDDTSQDYYFVVWSDSGEDEGVTDILAGVLKHPKT